MDERRVLEVKREVLSGNDRAADAFRRNLRGEGTFFVDVMASPGAGKTTLLLALIPELQARGVTEVGVIEADLESDVDALDVFVTSARTGEGVADLADWMAARRASELA